MQARLSACVRLCACLCRTVLHCSEMYLFSIIVAILLYCNGTSYSVGIGGTLLRVNRSERESDRSPRSSAKVKYKWIYTSTKLIHASNKWIYT
jgi:hypothetical protein